MKVLNMKLQAFETDTRRVDLSDLEFRLLSLLANNKALTAKELCDTLCVSNASLGRLIYFLRTKTKLDIKTLRGWKSYRLDDELYIG